MLTALFYPIAAYCLHFLFARATITRFLWIRYPKWLDGWATCAACMGTWTAAGVAALFGYWKHWEFLGLPGASWLTVVVVATIGMFTTPILANWHLRALIETIGSSQPPNDEETLR